MSDLAFLDRLLEGGRVEWRPLGDLGELVRGQGLPKSDFTVSGVPAIHYGQIYTYYGLFTHSTISFVSPETAATLRRVEKGDVIITNTSENFEDVGTPLVYFGEEPAVTGGHATIFKPNGSVLGMYLAYFTQTPAFDAAKRKYAKGIKVIDVSAKDLAKIEIPVPCPEEPEKSLAIQREIVRILDSFTELTAELTAELAARKKQYNHYRDQLLTFEEGEVEWKAIGDVFDLRAGQHIKATEIESKATEVHACPCFGGNGIRGFVRSKSHDGDYLLIGRQGALCGNVQRAKGPFYATEHAVVVTASEAINVDWAYHYLTFMNLNQFKSQSAQPGLAVGKLLGLKVPVPPIEDQNQAASILDKFDRLTTSLSEGLPREIALRQQQYEYYRDLLLSFPKPAEASEA